VKKPKGLNLIYVFLALTVFYLFMNTVFRFTPRSMAGRALLGVAFITGGFIATLWLLMINGLYLTKLVKTFIIVSLLVFVVGILAIPIFWLGFDIVYPTYIIGDAAVILWLCATIIVFGTIKNKREINFKRIYNFYLFLATTLLLYWIGLSLYNHSFGTPDFIVFSFIISGLIVSYIFQKKRFHLAFFYLIASFVLLVIGFWGHSRSFFVGYLFCFIVTLFMMFKFRNLKNWLIIFCILLLLCGAFFYFFTDTLRQSRFYSTLTTGEMFRGSSKTERFNEAGCAIKMMKKIRPTMLTGLGHGSTYLACVYLGGITVNLTEEGYVHTIHIGPILLFFRYGVLGLFLYVLFLFVLIKGFFFGRKLCNSISHSEIKEKYFPVRLFYINYFIYSILFLRFHSANVLINPFFALSLAITLMFISRPDLLRNTDATQHHET